MKKLLRLISVATILLAATSFMACSSDDDDDDSGARSASEHARGAIVGVVLDNRGEPVEGATVTLGNKTASTNHGGEFILENVDVNDPTVKAVQTTVSTSNALVPATATSNVSTTGTGAATYAYTLTVTKNDYISALIKGVYVTSAENIGGIEDARLSALKDQYATILNSYATAVGTGSIVASATGDGYGATIKDNEDKSATMTTVANALKEIQKLYSELGTTYSSTWAEGTLIPLNASLKGTLKLNPSPATAEVFNATTYTPSKKTKVTVTYKGNGSANYTYKAETDENGNFSFEKLPSGVTLGLAVEGFTDKAGDVTAYFSTDTGTVGSTAGSSKYRSNAAEILNNSSATLGSFTIDPNCLNVAGLDIMLFAQLEKIWVVNTNLLKNNDAALISVKDDITFEFNKEISRVSLAGSGLQDVTDKNYTVTIDATDAKKVTVKANDGVWTPAATDGGKFKLDVLAKDGTKELLNAEFQACFDTNIFVSITESSKNDKLLALSAPVVLTFSKPMSTATVTAKDGSTALTNGYTKTWSEDGTTLTLTPTKFWDKVANADGEVTFTVEGVAKDETTTIKYWKTGAAKASTSSTGYDCLKVYFDNYIDVTLAKVSDSKFTATFSKALKAIPAADLETNFKVYYRTTSDGTDTAVTDAKLSLDGAVLTVESKNADFDHYGFYSVELATNDVVGATGETKFRKSGNVSAENDKEKFTTDFTLGKEFKETAVEFVTTLPATAVASRVAYVDAGNYLKLTFNKAIKKAKLKVNAVAVVNYIDGNSIYLPLHGIVDEGEVKLTVDADTDKVTAVDGTTWDKVTKTGSNTSYDTGYKVQKNTFKMVATSLYTETASIAGGINNAQVVTIKPTDSVTFTFDQDVSGATWTAELYDADTVGVRNLNETLYKVTATAAAKVVTVALAEGSKALDYGKPYYLSLKAVKGTGSDVVILYDSHEFDKDSITYYAYIPGSTTVTYGNKIVVTPTGASKQYIKIETEAKEAKYDKIFVVKAGGNSKTTAFADFAKSNTSPIVLEFNQPVADFKAALVVSGYTAPETFAEIDKTKTFASTATVTGNVITITPTYGFPSNTEVVPVVYRDDGKKFTLNCESSGSSATVFLDSTNKYVSREIKDANCDAVITELAANAALKKIADLEIVNGADKTETTDPSNPVDNGAKIEFIFTPEYNFDMSPAKYTLFRKKSGNGAKWEEIKTTGTPVATTDALKVYVDYKRHEGAYNYEARQLLGLKAYFTETDANKSFNYGDISYVLVGTLDNSLVVSNTVVAVDKWCTFTYTPVSSGVTGTALTQEVKLGTITSTDVIKAGTVIISPAKDSSGTTITGTDAYTPYAVQKTSTEVEIYAKVNSKPAVGHKFEIHVKDNHNNESKSQTATIQ